MPLSALKHVAKLFAGGAPTPEEKAELLKETLLMTLARASKVDLNIDSEEVEAVRKILCEAIGHDVSAAEVRIAAQSELFDSTPIHKYLSKIRGKLNKDDILLIASSLAKVIQIDGHVRCTEADYFNSVVDALGLSAGEIAGLRGNSPAP